MNRDNLWAINVIRIDCFNFCGKFKYVARLKLLYHDKTILHEYCFFNDDYETYEMNKSSKNYPYALLLKEGFIGEKEIVNSGYNFYKLIKEWEKDYREKHNMPLKIQNTPAIEEASKIASRVLNTPAEIKASEIITEHLSNPLDERVKLKSIGEIASDALKPCFNQLKENFIQPADFGNLKKGDVIPMRENIVEEKQVIKDVYKIDDYSFKIVYNKGLDKQENFKSRFKEGFVWEFYKHELLSIKTLINEYFKEDIIKEVYEDYVGREVKLPKYYKIAKRLLKD